MVAKEDEVIVADIDLQGIPLQRRTIPYLRDLNKSAVVKSLTKI